MSVRILVFAAILLATAEGLAAPKGYEAKYSAAVKLENGGDLVGALAAFEAIPREARDFDTRLHIAGCKKKLGRLLDAEKDYESIRVDPAADGPTRETAESDLTDLRQRIPRVRITADAAADVTVTLDDQAVTTPLTVPVNPGTHRIVAKRGSAVVYERTVDVAEGTSIEIAVDAPIAARPASVSTTSKTEARSLAPAPANQTASIGWALIGAGVVSSAFGGFFLVKTANLVSERDDLAAKGDLRADDRASDARLMLTGARVGLGVGVVTLVAGTILVVRSRSTGEASALTATATTGGALFGVTTVW